MRRDYWGLVRDASLDWNCACLAVERFNRGLDLLGSPNFQGDDFKAERACRCLNRAHSIERTVTIASARAFGGIADMSGLAVGSTRLRSGCASKRPLASSVARTSVVSSPRLARIHK